MRSRTRLLQDIPLFTTLPRHERAAVAAAVQVRTYRHGERLVRAGEPCPDVVILLDGVVRLFRMNPDGTEVTTAIVSRGGIVAMATLWGSAIDDGDASAIGPVRTIAVPVPVFLDVMRRHPTVAEVVARSLIARTDDTFLDMATDVHGELDARILHVLRMLARPPGAADDGGVIRRVPYRLSHAEIARIVGATRSSVTRTLHLLDERGLVRLERGHVTGVRG